MNWMDCILILMVWSMLGIALVDVLWHPRRSEAFGWMLLACGGPAFWCAALCVYLAARVDRHTRWRWRWRR